MQTGLLSSKNKGFNNNNNKNVLSNAAGYLSCLRIHQYPVRVVTDNDKKLTIRTQ
jgi:hypothetical protein